MMLSKMFNNWRSRIGIDLQSLHHCVRLIVWATNERFSGDVVNECLLRRSELGVISSTGLWMHQSTSEARHENVDGNFKIKDCVKIQIQRVKCLCLLKQGFQNRTKTKRKLWLCMWAYLSQRSGIAVEQEGAGLRQHGVQDSAHNLVADEASGLHDGLCSHAVGSAQTHGLAQRVSGGHHLHSELVGNHFADGALAPARRPHDHQTQHWLGHGCLKHTNELKKTKKKLIAQS